MNAIAATTAACTAVSGGRVRVRAVVGLVPEGTATSRSLAAVGMTRVGMRSLAALGMTSIGMPSQKRTLRLALHLRDAQGWRPVDAVLALGIVARTQCCPSKHPDGYREVVLRR